MTVAPFAIERHPVTNAQFAEFVRDTGYVTVAERPLDPALYPGWPPGSAARCFGLRATAGPVNLEDWRRWWDWAPGAYWRRPFGEGSDIAGKDDHPVVQVAYPMPGPTPPGPGAALPTEAEFEYAARGGRRTPTRGARDPQPGGTLMANTWRAAFRTTATAAPGATEPRAGPAPRRWAPSAERLRLVDMIGNVWEWTTTKYSGHHQMQPSNSCPKSARPDPSLIQTLRAARTCAPPVLPLSARRARRSPRTVPPPTSASAAWPDG